LEIPQANPNHCDYLRNYRWDYRFFDPCYLYSEQYLFAADSAGGRIVWEFGRIGFAGRD
jgi:hypothetical protein